MQYFIIDSFAGGFGVLMRGWMGATKMDFKGSEGRMVQREIRHVLIRLLFLCWGLGMLKDVGTCVYLNGHMSSALKVGEAGTCVE